MLVCCHYVYSSDVRMARMPVYGGVGAWHCCVRAGRTVFIYASSRLPAACCAPHITAWHRHYRGDDHQTRARCCYRVPHMLPAYLCAQHTRPVTPALGIRADRLKNY